MNFNLGALSTTLAETPLERLATAIVNEPFTFQYDMVAMGIGIMVFLMVNPKTGIVHRVALSRTHLAEGTLRMSDKKFEDIDIPLTESNNIIAKAINDNEPQVTEDWKYLFMPALSAEQARMNQAGGGIACSFVYPVQFDQGSHTGQAALIFSYYKYLDKVGQLERTFMQGYAETIGNILGQHADIQEQIIARKAGRQAAD